MHGNNMHTVGKERSVYVGHVGPIIRDDDGCQSWWLVGRLGNKAWQLSW